MADATIDVVGIEELPLIVELYNQIFRPPRTVESLRRRYLGRYNVLQLVARVSDRPVGFFLGFELKPDTFFAWFYGVLADTQGDFALAFRHGLIVIAAFCAAALALALADVLTTQNMSLHRMAAMHGGQRHH